MRNWTIEERKKQANLIRQWQPWKHSTGAKTAQGKAKSSMNAFKGGFMKELKSLKKTLKEQEIYINSVY
jgi:hypothetical protein